MVPIFIFPKSVYWNDRDEPQVVCSSTAFLSTISYFNIFKMIVFFQWLINDFFFQKKLELWTRCKCLFLMKKSKNKVKISIDFWPPTWSSITRCKYGKQNFICGHLYLVFVKVMLCQQNFSSVLLWADIFFVFYLRVNCKSILLRSKLIDVLFLPSHLFLQKT